MITHYELMQRIFEQQYQDELARKSGIDGSVAPLTAGLGLLVAGVSFVFTRMPALNAGAEYECYEKVALFVTYIVFGISIILAIICGLRIWSMLHNNQYKYLPSPKRQLIHYENLEKYYEENNINMQGLEKDILRNYIANLAECTTFNMNTNDTRFGKRVEAYRFLGTSFLFLFLAMVLTVMLL